MPVPVTTGLIAHFDADLLEGYGSGDPITQWDSIYGNALLSLTPQGGLAPTFAPGAMPVSLRNGVDFGGAARLGGTFDPDTEVIPSAATFIWVARGPVNDGSIKFFFSSNGLVLASKWSNANRWVFGQNQFSFIEFTDTTPINAPAIWTYGYRATGAFVRLNKVQKVTGNHGVASSNQFWMGAFDGANSGFTMFEMLIYDHVLTPTDIDLVEAYLSDKWNEPQEAEATFTAVAQGQFVTLSVQAPGAESVTITRRTFDGAEIRVRGIVNAPLTLDAFVGYDYEAPQGRDLEYTAYITYPDDDVVELVAFAGIVDYGGDYIMPVGRWELGMNLFVEWDGISPKEHSMIQDTVPILGRKGPVTVSWGRLLPRGSISFLTMEDEDRRNFLRICEYPVVMFAARPGFGYDDPVFLSLETVTEERTIGYGGESSRRWIVDVQEVDRPPAAYVLPVLANSWQYVDDTYTSWGDVRDTGFTWYGLAGYP